jgi:hypothetical protein
VTTYEVRFTTNINLAVKVDAEDEDQARDIAHDAAQDYLATVTGNHRDVSANAASLDGIGADEVEEIEP